MECRFKNRIPSICALTIVLKSTRYSVHIIAYYIVRIFYVHINAYNNVIDKIARIL